MGTFPRRCRACRFCFDWIGPSARRGSTRCPQCGGATETNAADLHVRLEHRFVGSDATNDFYRLIPEEVPDARKLLGDTGAEFSDDGHVVLRSARIVDRFKQAWRERVATVPPKTGTGGIRRPRRKVTARLT